MILSYLPVLMLLGVAVAFPVGLLWLSSMLGPKVRSNVKSEAYECGVPPVGSTRERIPVKFYKLAILFLIFDVEAALLFPWAVLFRSKLPEWGAPFLLAELGVFLAVLLVGYVFAWSRGGLEWD
ncbi:MAG: NADH-quinone oxidoreductase subunit A [Pseudomonadota bacterium]